jgi:LmbE family N-acetylglucosaminyl deacetylase
LEVATVLAKDLIPIPDLEAAREVLCIQPHPDDLEIGAGATVAKLVKAGAHVTYVTVTDGGLGSIDLTTTRAKVAAIRRGEQERAAAGLGVTDLIWLGYPDAGAFPPMELREHLMDLIREHRPQAVLLPDPWLPYEAHPDHRAVGLVAAEAILFAGFPTEESRGPRTKGHDVGTVAFYFTAKPNTFVDVDQTWDQKLAAIKTHESQFNENTLAMFSLYFDVKARENAEAARKKATELGGPAPTMEKAEAFKVLTPIHLHVNVDAEIS